MTNITVLHRAIAGKPPKHWNLSGHASRKAYVATTAGLLKEFGPRLAAKRFHAMDEVAADLEEKLSDPDFLRSLRGEA